MSDHEWKNGESLPLSSVPSREMGHAARALAQQRELLKEADFTETERAEISERIDKQQRELGISDEQIKDLLE